MFPRNTNFRLKNCMEKKKKILLIPKSPEESVVKNKYYDPNKKNYKRLTKLLRQRKPLAFHADRRGADGKGINGTRDKLLSWKIIPLKYK